MKLPMAMWSFISSSLLLLGQIPRVSSSPSRARVVERSSRDTSNATGLQEVFQVYQPVSFTSHGASGCDIDVLLMDYEFGESYGVPYVGKINLTTVISHELALILEFQGAIHPQAVNSILSA